MKASRRHAERRTPGGRRNIDFPVRRGHVVVDDDACASGRLALGRFALGDVVAEELVLRALQLTLGNGFMPQLVELRDERLLRLFGCVPWLDDRDRKKQVRLFNDVAAAVRGRRDALLVDERFENPRALAIREDLRRDMQRVRVRMSVIGDRIGDDDGRQRPVFGGRDPPLATKGRLLRIFAWNRALARGNPAEIFGDQLHRLGRVEVADEGERGVARHIVRAVKLAHVGHRGGVEILHAADGGVLVGMHDDAL